MNYVDELILWRREEKRKEQYSTLEEGVYMNGETLTFGRKDILGVMEIMLPDEWKQMPEKFAKIKYPSEFRPGIIKCQGFIFLISEENTIQYQPSAGYISLKFRLIKVEELTDYVRYQWDFVLDGRLRREQGEIELCRFKLKEGAALRTDYKDFYDIQTEYDTVNLADATWSSPGGHTLSKEITDFFAKKVLECGCAQEGDVQFAYFLLQSKEAVNYPILMDYIARKSWGKKQGWGMAKEETPGRDDGGAVDCVEVFGMLAEILDGIRHGGGWKGRRETEGEEGMIVWE